MRLEIIAGVTLLWSALSQAGCKEPGHLAASPAGEAAAPLQPSDEAFALPPLPRARVTLHDAFGGTHAVAVEVAATAPARERGLMWRRSLADGQGMLFIFPRAERQSFWMQNTLVPLDMLFVDSTFRVVGLVSGAVPKDPTPHASPAPAKYVIEVPGGWADRQGIRVGSRADIEGIAPIAVGG